MSYELRKLYADLVTADGTVCVLYLTWVRLLGRWHARTGLEIYWADGRREVRHGTGAPPPPENDATLDRIALDVQLPGGLCELRFEPEHGALMPASRPCPSLSWSVKLARGRSTLRAPDLGELTGIGYADWVSLTRATRLLGLRSLTWGRAHLPDATVVFTELDFVHDRPWRAAGRGAAPGKPLEAIDASAQLAEHGRGRIELANGAAAIALEPRRVLHAGNAFGPERVPRRLDRVVARAVGGATFETRWLGRASDGDRSGWAVYERVAFGAA
jgi:hypothetical protein